jgi:3-methylcrotonyl-CoA carboxylase beta subunit
MGPDQAAGVLTQVRRDSLKAKGTAWPETEETAYYEEIKSSFTAQTEALYATARLWDDGIIEPLATRNTLALALSLATHDPAPRDRTFATFRM